MQIFKDKDGNPWEIDFTIGLMEEVKAKTEVDLLDPVNEDSQLIMSLSPIGVKGIVLFCNTLYLVCEDQCKERELSSSQFGKLLSSTSLKDAYEAFFKEWEDFFLSLGRTDIAEAMKRWKELIAQGMEELVEEIKKITMEDVQKQIES